MTAAAAGARAARALAARVPVKCLLALTFGTALAMSFAPARAWWFAPYCVAGLLLLLDVRLRSAFWIGACFGMGWFGAGFWWIAPALDGFSESRSGVTVGLTAVLVVYLSLFPACAAVLITQCRRTLRPGLRGRLSMSLRIALIFAVAEWARGTLFGGFSMAATGYAHADGPLSGFAPLIGVNGLGFLNAWIAALLAGACCRERAQRSGRPWIEAAAALGLAALVLASGALLKQVAWTHDSAGTLSVSLLQGNLPQSEKYSDAGFVRAVDRYLALASRAQGRLIVLPETALPVEWSSMPPVVARSFQEIADARGATIVIGAVAYRAAAGPARRDLANSAIALQPHQASDAASYRYDKHHLVPFSETLPPGAAWIGRLLGMDGGGLAPGPAQQAPLLAAGVRIGITICFESLFDTAVARRAGDAELMLNLTNFAWSTGSWAAVQHLQAAQMRALETGRWLAQASNTGDTALIDAHGRIRQQLPPDVPGILDAEVRLLSGQTPFMMLGNWPLLIAAALAWAGTIRRRLRALARRGAPCMRWRRA